MSGRVLKPSFKCASTCSRGRYLLPAHLPGRPFEAASPSDVPPRTRHQYPVRSHRQAIRLVDHLAASHSPTGAAASFTSRQSPSVSHSCLQSFSFSLAGLAKGRAALRAQLH
eukprot:3325663-Pleurochrysis_carterae.AAC.1